MNENKLVILQRAAGWGATLVELAEHLPLTRIIVIVDVGISVDCENQINKAATCEYFESAGYTVRNFPQM
jgi:hypothetical protein